MNNPPVETAGGTAFVLDGERVLIVRSDQPECSIPLADLREFVEALAPACIRATD